MTEVIDPLTAPEIFFDGVYEIKIVEGVVRIALFSRQNSSSTVTARLVVPASELPDVIQAFVKVLAEAMRPSMRMTIGQMAH
jgi:ABC-type nitrate/sulfonate/bicarbonate transport system substrate-binding protein